MQLSDYGDDTWNIKLNHLVEDVGTDGSSFSKLIWRKNT